VEEDEKINRIIILEKNVIGDLHRCKVCNINFTAMQTCILCQLVIEKEQELGRKLTKQEFHDTIKWFK